jgi:predicted phosphodiesterase
MQVALFGDIHANLEALEAVLADAREHNCSDYVCLGDVVGYNANPVECLNIVRDMGCAIVKGNHDEEAYGDHSLDMMNPIAAHALAWTRKQLSEDKRSWLKNLRMIQQIEDFTIVHSTLDQPSNWSYVTNRFDAMANFSYQFSQICFHGHTHIPKVYVRDRRVHEIEADTLQIEEGVKYFINIGSVGQPRDGDPRGCYVIYDTESRSIVFRRVEYDIKKTQQKIIAAGLPEILSDRLLTGR